MNKIVSSILALVFWVQPVSVFAASTAKVLIKRGEVTKLSPGEVKASPVKVGDLLPEDTSILTGEKSMVRLKFSNNSTMNLGPRSKVVVSKMAKQKPNMINLLTGAIKAEVDKKKNKENKNKMIVKTRSAVMGVRGTKFQAIYNPQNKNTSLITVEGRVAMVKKEAALKQAVAASEGVKEAKGQLVNTSNNQIVDSATELDALDKSLQESTEVVEVEAGKFSGVQKSKEAPSQPVKIAPKQYEAIAKSMGSENKAIEVMKTADAASEIKKLGEAPRPGGFVDFETGIYVPPSEDAKLDSKTATFTSKEMGDVDKITGDYVPPKGVKLDAKKGFVVDQEELAKVTSNQEREDLQRTIAKVQSVNNQINVNQTQGTVEKQKRWYLPEGHELAFELVPYSEAQTFSNNDGDSEFFSESALDTILSWKQKWSEKWSSRIAIGGVDYSVEEKDGKFREINDEDDGFFSLGAFYKYSTRLSYSAELISKPFYFVYPGDFSGDVFVDPQLLDFFSFGAKYHAMDWKKIGLYAGANVLLFGENELHPADSPDKETYTSFGFKLYGEGTYSIKKNMALNAGVFFQRINHDFDGDTEITRTALGSSLNFNYSL